MQSHKIWLAKAESDLRASEKLVSDEVVWDVAIYHTQQCAEKALNLETAVGAGRKAQSFEP